MTKEDKGRFSLEKQVNQPLTSKYNIKKTKKSEDLVLEKGVRLATAEYKEEHDILQLEISSKQDTTTNKVIQHGRKTTLSADYTEQQYPLPDDPTIYHIQHKHDIKDAVPAPTQDTVEQEKKHAELKMKYEKLLGENKSKKETLQSFNDQANSLKVATLALDEQQLEEKAITSRIDVLKKEIYEHKGYKKELDDIIDGLNEKGIEHDGHMKELDQEIEAALNLLSENKV